MKRVAKKRIIAIKRMSADILFFMGFYHFGTSCREFLPIFIKIIRKVVPFLKIVLYNTKRRLFLYYNKEVI